MEVLISAMLPVALVALVGFGVGRSFELDMQTLTRLNIYALLPALVLTSLAETTLAMGSAIAIITSFLLNTVVLYLLAVGLSRRLDFSVDEQKSLIAIVMFSNVGNLGLPFILFALGEAGLERAVVYLVGSSVMIATVFPIVLQQAGLKAGINVTLRLPVFWAALAGIGLQATHEAFPLPLERGMALLGEGAIPVALLTLGVQLARTELVFDRYELIGAVLRLVVAPLLAYGIGTALGLQGLDRQVLVLQAAMPVAVNSLIWVTELGGDRTRVARTIVLSTFLSVFTLPVVLWLSS
ncbi:AEC family transporter [Nodosilinea sp. FACHB-13]|uniref:AEC family transporter n=1 Tax=Cyanophyceae TaxID=3028117 RepID=UPI001681E82A|nr:AEC family transporter [Nodosilinea sp. FACHB-13]MBD2108945.1 AEC family transporter [Nodosilinea sp. FACHB-13]